MNHRETRRVMHAIDALAAKFPIAARNMTCAVAFAAQARSGRLTPAPVVRHAPMTKPPVPVSRPALRAHARRVAFDTINARIAEGKAPRASRADRRIMARVLA